MVAGKFRFRSQKPTVEMRVVQLLFYVLIGFGHCFGMNFSSSAWVPISDYQTYPNYEAFDRAVRALCRSDARWVHIPWRENTTDNSYNLYHSFLQKRTLEVNLTKQHECIQALSQRSIAQSLVHNALCHVNNVCSSKGNSILEPAVGDGECSIGRDKTWGPIADTTVLAINKFGGAYYHTIIHDLASIVLFLDLLRNDRNMRLSMSTCKYLDARGEGVRARVEDWSNPFLVMNSSNAYVKDATRCQNTPYILELLDLFNISLAQIIQPRWIQQREAPMQLYQKALVTCPRSNVYNTLLTKYREQILRTELLSLVTVVPEFIAYREPLVIFINRLSERRSILNFNESLAVLQKGLSSIGAEIVGVYCEHYSVREQLSIFHQADVIVAPHGAALTNILAAKSSAKILEIVGMEDNNPCYADLCQNLDLEYFPIIENSRIKAVDEHYKISDNTLATIVQTISNVLQKTEAVPVRRLSVSKSS